MKHTITVLAIFFIIAGCETKQKSKESIKESIMDKNVAVISTQFGDIVLEFFDDIAPKHVESFKLHAQNGYYNGTTFHRVIPGFMIQGGDPLTKSEDRSRHGTGGNAAKYFGIGTESEESSWDLPAEFSATPHARGILSMARSNNPDSGGSQFFICVADARFLDNQYTVFGKVVSGMDVVDAIVSAPRDARDNPDDRIEMKVRLEDKK
jgi:peptidyl-prolyl cis-trans isomerase B (cyclophilin B)